MRTAIRILGVFLAAAVISQCGDGGSSPADRLLAEWSRAGIVPVTDTNPDGSQSLAVLARGGYFALKATAKAGIPSVLRIYTHETYDCSRAFVIPELRLRKVLPASGVVEIPVPARAAGTKLFGTCSMGMYRFTILFE